MTEVLRQWISIYDWSVEIVNIDLWHGNVLVSHSISLIQNRHTHIYMAIFNITAKNEYMCHAVLE